MITEHKGDLFTSDAPAIGHGVNCKGLMGAGIAKEFRSRYPDMYVWYKNVCQFGGLRPGQILEWPGLDGKFIINIASQDDPGPNAKYTYLISGLVQTCLFLKSQGVDRLAIPQIGCGIGGLNWGNTLSWIQAVSDDYDMHIEVWSL